MSTVLYAAFYFMAVKMPFGKTFFTLLMLSNTANLIVISSKCIEGLIFPALAVQNYRWSFSLMMFIVEAAVFTPIFIYMKKIYTPAVEKEPSGIEWRYLWLIPATFYVVWYYMIYGNTSASSLEIALKPKSTFILLLVNIGAFLIYFVVAKLISEQSRNMELWEKNHQLQMQNLQYENLQTKITEARRAKHDVRHHISILRKYVSDRNLEGLNSYLNSYQSDLPDDSLNSYCENAAVNAVLLYFAQQAKECSVTFNAEAVVPANTSIDETDLSVLLGNLIENALDACIADKSANKKIGIKAKYDNYALWLTVDNTFTGKLNLTKSGTYLSTKHSGSGLGISSVKAIAEKYNGVSKFEADGEMFYASIMLGQK